MAFKLFAYRWTTTWIGHTMISRQILNITSSSTYLEWLSSKPPKYILDERLQIKTSGAFWKSSNNSFLRLVLSKWDPMLLYGSASLPLRIALIQNTAGFSLIE